jgi:ornithine cyclodeaminase
LETVWVLGIGGQALLVINQQEVEQLLPMEAAMDAVEKAFKALSTGEALNPLRRVMFLLDDLGVQVAMPAYLGSQGTTGLKAITVFPGNEGTAYESHQGAVLLFGTEHGELQAVVDASAITAIRTAAASGVATRLLAREDAENLAILGSGTQATAHLEAMLLVRAIRRVRVWSRTPAHARRFAKQATERHRVVLQLAPTAREAVQGADIICTTTSAPTPILLGEWLKPGMHVNAVGSSVPFARELDTSAIVKSRLFVDRRESTLNEAGEFLMPLKEGAVDEAHIQAEIGEILLGQNPGRVSFVEVTLFKSLGLAVQDLASAHAVYRAALEQGLGTDVELGGARHLTG